MALRILPNLTRQLAMTSVRAMSSEFGSGAGKGGGAGGSIREAGGAFGKQEAAREEQYFRKLQSKQLQEMKEHYHKLHVEEIKKHEEAIQKHKEAISDLQKDKSGSDSD